MKRLWIENNKPIIYTDLPTSQLFSGIPLIKVLQAGIGNMDLSFIWGCCPYQRIIDHKFAGVVRQGPSHHRFYDKPPILNFISVF
ncbi:MAG: hypothetical protein KPI85_02840 [cyanobacterium endosymbiont of Epithemia adnata isolate EadnSB Bon19]